MPWMTTEHPDNLTLAEAIIFAPDDEVPRLVPADLTLALVMDGCIDGTEATGGGKTSMKGKLSGEVMNVTQIVVDVDASVAGNTVQQTK